MEDLFWVFFVLTYLFFAVTHSVIDGHFPVFLPIVIQHNYVLRRTERAVFEDH